MKYFFYLTISLLLFSNCKNENNTDKALQIQSKRDSIILNNFIEFLDTFNTDSAYQMSHIIFPLEGETRASVEQTDSLIPHKWEKNNWKLHHKFNDFDGIFKRNFLIFDENTIIEKTVGVNGLFKMEKRFAKMKGGWTLIFFSTN